MPRRHWRTALWILALSSGAPALAVSHATSGPAQPLPEVHVAPVAASSAGAQLDDLSFVVRAHEDSEQDMQRLADALAQLESPELQQLAQRWLQALRDTQARLLQLAAAKRWPLLIDTRRLPTSTGRASTDFDDIWIETMIATQERALALYAAQAQSGDDPDVRRFARDTLPQLQQHLSELRNTQP